MQREVTDDLDLLLEALPPHICKPLRDREDNHELLEIVMDLGRLPESRYPAREVILSDNEVTEADIDYVVSRIGEFGDDNRAGIERTLHRISAIRNRRGRIVGLTCRVGRAVYGTIQIIEDLVQSGKSLLLLGRPGVGKCVTGTTLVLTDAGVQLLADLIPANQEVDTFLPTESYVYGLNGIEPASHTYSGGSSETRIVTTRYGFSVEGTPEHPLLALSETGDLVFRRLDELKPGDYLAIQRNQQQFGTDDRLPVFAFTPRTNALDCRLPEELDEDLGRFLGYLIAEGTLSFDNQVCFSNGDPEVQSDMVTLTDRLFGLRLRKHLFQGEWNGNDYRIFGVKVRRFLSHLGLSRGRAADKRIPPCIFTAPKPVVRAFLSALFEGDGSVYGTDGRIEIASASRSLVAELQVLLLNFGIVAKLRTKRNRTYDRDYYCLTMLGENVARFAEEIGFLSTRKRTRLASCLASREGVQRNPNFDTVPFQNETIRTLRATAGVSAPTLERFSKRDNRAPSYRSLGRILSEASTAGGTAAYQRLSVLHETGYFFDPVVSIAAGYEYVYDVTVPGSHSFFANGFISHNTTMLRETARVLADDLGKRVVIVDTSNEIAGDGDIPHPAIGSARRMQVPTPALQHAIMIEAVENHMPEVIVIDEIGTELEAAAARTINERGVQLVGTAHGNELENLMLNPTLSDLIGGIQSVTLGDEEARRRGTQKSILERKAPPTFDVIVEIQSWQRVAVHENVADTVDAILRGFDAPPEVRELDENGEVRQVFEQPQPRSFDPVARSRRSERPVRPERGTSNGRPLGRGQTEAARPVQRIFSVGVNKQRIEQAIRDTGVDAVLTEKIDDADVVFTLPTFFRKKPQSLRDAEARNIDVHVLKSNTGSRIMQALTSLRPEPTRPRDEVLEAMEETEEAIGTLITGNRHQVDLEPQNAYIRRIQHQIAQQFNVGSRSHGREPNRRVRVFRDGDTSLPFED